MNKLKEYFLKIRFSYIRKNSKDNLAGAKRDLRIGNELSEQIPDSSKEITKAFAKARHDYYFGKKFSVKAHR